MNGLVSLGEAAGELHEPSGLVAAAQLLVLPRDDSQGPRLKWRLRERSARQCSRLVEVGWALVSFVISLQRKSLRILRVPCQRRCCAAKVDIPVQEGLLDAG